MSALAKQGMNHKFFVSLKLQNMLIYKIMAFMNSNMNPSFDRFKFKVELVHDTGTVESKPNRPFSSL